MNKETATTITCPHHHHHYLSIIPSPLFLPPFSSYLHVDQLAWGQLRGQIQRKLLSAGQFQGLRCLPWEVLEGHDAHAGQIWAVDTLVALCNDRSDTLRKSGRNVVLKKKYRRDFSNMLFINFFLAYTVS